MFAFICDSCGYGVGLNSGVLLECPLCGEFATLMRTTHMAYHACETNDGKIEEKPNE